MDKDIQAKIDEWHEKVTIPDLKADLRKNGILVR